MLAFKPFLLKLRVHSLRIFLEVLIGGDGSLLGVGFALPWGVAVLIIDPSFLDSSVRFLPWYTSR